MLTSFEIRVPAHFEIRVPAPHYATSGPLWTILRTFGVLFENRPALYFCNYKENKKNTRMLDTLFIDDSLDIMEQYFHYYNHNWQLNIKNLGSIFDTESKNICFIGSN